MKYLGTGLALVLLVGCAPHRAYQAQRVFHNCKQVSVNAKTGETTIVCPKQ